MVAYLMASSRRNTTANRCIVTLFNHSDPFHREQRLIDGTASSSVPRFDGKRDQSHGLFLLRSIEADKALPTGANAFWRASDDLIYESSDAAR